MILCNIQQWQTMLDKSPWNDYAVQYIKSLNMATNWSMDHTSQDREEQKSLSEFDLKKHTIFWRACILLSCTLIGWVLYSRILICYTVWCGTSVFCSFVSLSWSILHLLSLLLWCFLPLPFTTPPFQTPYLLLLVPPFLCQSLSLLLFTPTSSFYSSSSCFEVKGMWLLWWKNKCLLLIGEQPSTIGILGEI